MPSANRNTAAARIVDRLLTEAKPVNESMSASQLAEIVGESFSGSAPASILIQSNMGGQPLTVVEAWRDGDTLRVAVELPAAAT